VPVAFSCIGFLVLQFAKLHQSDVGSGIALFILSLLACVEKLSAVMNTICVERDWVIIVGGDDQSSLASLNAQMWRIDLFCKLVGPLAISLVDSYSSKAAIIVTGSMSSLSFLAKYFAVARVYWSIPAMQAVKDQAARTPTSTCLNVKTLCSRAAASSIPYVRHTAFFPSACLALLYLTVLSFSGQLITYLLSLGLSSAIIAIIRGMPAVFELSAAWLGPYVVDRVGSVRSGIWFLNAEVFFVRVACACIWLPATTAEPSLATFGLILSVILSRVGLWGFDLSAQLTIQEDVEPDLRGTFSSLEFSLQNFFEVLSFAFTVYFSRTEQFKYPTLVSALAVWTASVLYTYYVRRKRGNLIHVPKCLRRYFPKQEIVGWQRVPATCDEVGLEMD
jgi:iron-regulated transporter 1